MIPALLITILPAVLCYILLSKTGVKIQSSYLKISLSWFLGIYIFSFFVFVLAILLSFIASGVLFKASVVGLFSVGLLLFKYRKDVLTLREKILPAVRTRTLFKPLDIFIIGFCLFFSFIFFKPHLTYTNDSVFTSPIYWDFGWHVGVIQNFAYGDNFPPQNESFSGIPQTYHFFGDFVVAVYEVMGLHLVDAMNVVSILVFFFILMTIIGCCEELFQSKIAGIIAVALSITSSSMHFVNYFTHLNTSNILEIIKDIIQNSGHPWYFSFLPGEDVSRYSGVMFNLFYLLVERHMMFGVVFLLLSVWIISQREKLSNRTLFIIGCLMGAFFLWHFYITVMVFCALLFLLIFHSYRKETLWILSGFTIVFGIQYFVLKQIIVNPDWFIQTTINYPRLDFSFATIGEKYNTTLMIQNAWKYWSFAYGLKIILLPISLVILWKRNNSFGAVLTAVILTSFIIINCLVVSPEGGADNHKFLRPMNFVIDIAVAYLVFNFFFQKRNIGMKVAGIICITLLTASGILENMPFINSKPTEMFSLYPTALINTIRENTSPKSVFAGRDTRQFHLAGRKLFIGSSAGPNSSTNKEFRQAITLEIYRTSDIKSFCKLTKKYEIDYVEFDNTIASPLTSTIGGFPHLRISEKNDNTILLADIRKGCL